MRLTDLATAAVERVVQRMLRTALAYGICALCAVAVLVLAISASVLALEPHVGMVYARLIVAAAFVLTIAATLLWLHLGRPRKRKEATAPIAPRLEVNGSADRHPGAPLAMIAEAVMLGYSLSRRSQRR